MTARGRRHMKAAASSTSAQRLERWSIAHDATKTANCGRAKMIEAIVLILYILVPVLALWGLCLLSEWAADNRRNRRNLKHPTRVIR